MIGTEGLERRDGFLVPNHSNVFSCGFFFVTRLRLSRTNLDGICGQMSMRMVIVDKTS